MRPNPAVNRSHAVVARLHPRQAARRACEVSDLLHHLSALEVELHHPGVRCDRARLEQLLHAEFHEVGRSGIQYDRRTVIEFLAVQDAHPTVVSDGFAVLEASTNVALLSYRSAHIEQGKGLVRHTLRSSLWLKASSGWQLRYHQGTPAAEPWQTI